jgi:hypothetical protein
MSVLIATSTEYAIEPRKKRDKGGGQSLCEAFLYLAKDEKGSWIRPSQTIKRWAKRGQHWPPIRNVIDT